MIKDNKIYFFEVAKRNAERKRKVKEELEKKKHENKYGERVEFKKEETK